MGGVRINDLISTYNLFYHENDIFLFDIRDFIIYESELIQYLSREEKERWEFITSESGKKRFLIRKGIIRILLSHYLNIEPSEIEFQYDEYNKPWVLNTNKKINFNLSHSRQYLIVGVNIQGMIGVDIETNESINKRDKQLFMDIFSKEELTLFHTVSEDEQRRMFHSIWVQKEAISKALGFGLTMDFSDIDLSRGEKEYDDYVKYLIFDKEIKVQTIQDVDYFVAIATL